VVVCVLKPGSGASCNGGLESALLPVMAVLRRLFRRPDFLAGFIRKIGHQSYNKKQLFGEWYKMRPCFVLCFLR
jgi:hypothetical protein